MSIFCRLCADPRDSSEIVTSINDSEHLTEQKLIACCQWNPQNTEFELPQDVCLFCFEKLENSWSFLQSVQLAQRKIQGMFEHVEENRPMTRTVRTRYECSLCTCTFPSRIALEKHICTESESDMLKCNICQKIFQTAESHLAHCEKQGKFKCEVCLQLCCTNKALENHKQESCSGIIESIEVVETKPTFVDCSSSDAAQEPTNSTDLIQAPLEDSEYSNCPIRNQIITEDDRNDLDFLCYLCNRRFKKFPLLKYHMVVHTLPRRFKCQYCNSRFRTERHYTSHQKNHIDYFCDICHKKFPSAFALKVHRRMHVGASVKMYGCEECDHFFVDVSTYYNHMRRRHGLDTAEAKKRAKLVQPNGTAKPYVCEQCGKDFLERSSLKAHSVVHLDIRPFQCDVCPKAFKNKYNLKTHQETHSGEKSVQCTECGKRYSRKSVLIKHMEEHTGVYTKTFPCDFCDRIFRSLYNMQNHRRTHTGEKPFRCDVCNHDVTTKSQLDRHLKTISHINKLNESLGVNARPNIV